VLEVEHLVTRRKEVMKVLSDELTSDEAQLQRFMREIQVQASLSHPNLVSVHNAFQEGGLLCLVMERVEGRPLSKLIEEGPIPPARALSIACQALSALAHAHEHGVIHRDVKPGNILVGEKGLVSLTDFGLAKSSADPDLTKPGVAMGSVHYMAPEQVRGLPSTDTRADLYSLGVILYEMSTGRKPFEGPDGFAVMKSQVEEVPPPPENFTTELPPGLNEVILRSLSKDPDNRYQSAEEFLKDLRAIRSHLVPGGMEEIRKPRFWPRMHYILLRVITVCAVAATVLVCYSTVRSIIPGMEVLPPLPSIPWLSPPAPPPDATKLTPPPSVRQEAEPTSPPAEVKPRQAVTRRAAPKPKLKPPPPSRPMRAVVIGDTGIPPEPVTISKPSVEAPQLEAPPVLRAEIVAAPPPPAAEAPEPPKAERKSGAVKRFFGRLNPLRLKKKPTDKAAEQANNPQ
jgi:serine/threonine-protein kinase